MIRAAAPSDAAAIAAVWNPVIRDTLVTFDPAGKSPAEVAATIQARAEADHGFFVAEGPDGALLGFATYAQFRGGPGYARTMEHTIILAPGARGRGIGRALMATVEGHAASRGAHSMFAGVSAANSAGVAFHAALGYREVARLPEVGWKFGRWLDLILLQKML